MEHIDTYLIDFLRYTAGVSEEILSWVYPLTAAFAIAVLSYVCTAVFRFAVMPAVQKVTEKTRNKWDDYIFDQRVMKAFRRLIPPVVWYVCLPLVFTGSPWVLSFLLKACNIYLVVVSLMFVSVFIHSLYEISEAHQKLRNRPLKGIYQMFNLLAVVVGCILIVSILIDKSAGAVLAGLGASAAVLMLIFKDSILGLVAGVQLSANDMLRPGDWITMQKYGANGYVRGQGAELRQDHHYHPALLARQRFLPELARHEGVGRAPHEALHKHRRQLRALLRQGRDRPPR